MEHRISHNRSTAMIIAVTLLILLVSVLRPFDAGVPSHFGMSTERTAP
jgi:hypothetical protein